MIHTLYRAVDGTLHTDLPKAKWPVALRDDAGLLWIDLVAEPSDVCRPILHDDFGFHNLAVDDALEETHVPKVDDWNEYIYLTLHAVIFDETGEDPLDTLELDIFLGRNYVVTYQSHPIGTVERVRKACLRDPRYLERGTAYLLHKLADEIVADYMPVIEQIDEAVDEVESQILDNPAPIHLERLLVQKRAILQLRRILAPQREVLNKLGRGDFAIIPAEYRMFYRDVYDHLFRLHDLTENVRDLINSTLDTYLSVVNNRMNDVMKALTVITTLFMPLSFLTGFFGMNFFQPILALDTWTGAVAFGLVLGAMVALPIGMFVWMRRQRWM